MRRAVMAGLSLILSSNGLPTEPVRATSVQTPALRLVVNIPAFRVDVFANDSLARRMRVAVGQRGYQTPRGEFEITSVEWNPWWIPPDRPWAAKEKPQPPGPTNPMGRVKINFRPLYFLHGTPLEQSIGSAASHGCVRMHTADAIALGRLVLAAGAPALREDDIAHLAADTVHTRLIQLEHPVPITLVYDLVEVEHDSVFVYRDVYGLATRSLREDVLAALVERGIDTTHTDSARLRRLVAAVATGGNAAAIGELVAR